MDENPQEVVRREASEEAGCRVSDLQPMCKYYSSPGGSTEEIQLYLGRTQTRDLGGIHGLEHEGEDIRVHIVSSDTAFDWLDQGRIDSAMPIIALQWFRLNRQDIRNTWL